jgi:hypothetical protein
MKQLPNEWWGDHTFEVGNTARWEIGPLQVAVQRFPYEWLVAYEYVEMREDRQEWRFSYSDLDLDETELSHVSRYVCQSTTDQLTVLPALADRSVVSRPITPFNVGVGENTTIYISTPLWFTVSTCSPSQMLFEVAIQRPSDTWFGPSTLEGESCYASRTYARLNLENLIALPYRAVTQVHIHNTSTAPLLIERLNVPVTYLSLFQTPDNVIWTETVTVVQERSASLAEFSIEGELPSQAAGAELIAVPRQNAHKGMFIRAFSALKLQGFD